MNEEPETAAAQQIARGILRYLLPHPEAKDTLDGIAQWWLGWERGEPARGDVERAVSLLLSQGFILETRRQGLQPYYGLNPQKQEEIFKFLHGS